VPASSVEGNWDRHADYEGTALVTSSGGVLHRGLDCWTRNPTTITDGLASKRKGVRLRLDTYPLCRDTFPAQVAHRMCPAGGVEALLDMGFCHREMLVLGLVGRGRTLPECEICPCWPSHTVAVGFFQPFNACNLPSRAVVPINCAPIHVENKSNVCVSKHSLILGLFRGFPV